MANNRIISSLSMVISRRIGLALGAALVLALTIFSACDDLITEQTIVILDLESEFVAVCPDGTVSDTGCAGCAPFTVNYQDTSQGRRTKWFWNFGDGNTSTDANPTHTYDSVGLFRVSLRITDDTTGVSDEEIKNRFIFVGEPVTGFTASDSILIPGDSVTFTPLPDTGFAQSWLWEFGDGGSSTLRKPTHVYNSVGLFDVKLIATCFADSAFADTTEIVDSALIRIVQKPVVNIATRRDSLCVPFQMNFFDSSQVAGPAIINSWQWDAGNGQTSSSADFNAIFSLAQDYWVKLTVQTDSGGSATDSILITAYDLPFADFSVSATFGCIAQFTPFTVNFTNQSTGNILAYQWDFGDDSVSTLANPSHDYTRAGLYDVTLSVIGSCFPLGIPPEFNTIVKSGLIFVPDSIRTDSVSFAITPPTGDTNTVFTMADNTSGYVTGWTWMFNDTGQIGIDSSVQFRFTLDGTYEIKLYVLNTCMIDSVFAVDTVIVSTP